MRQGGGLAPERFSAARAWRLRNSVTGPVVASFLTQVQMTELDKMSSLCFDGLQTGNYKDVTYKFYYLSLDKTPDSL